MESKQRASPGPPPGRKGGRRGSAVVYHIVIIGREGRMLYHFYLGRTGLNWTGRVGQKVGCAPNCANRGDTTSIVTLQMPGREDMVRYECSPLFFISTTYSDSSEVPRKKKPARNRRRYKKKPRGLVLAQNSTKDNVFTSPTRLGPTISTKTN